jgi:hypothetical protein
MTSHEWVSSRQTDLITHVPIPKWAVRPQSSGPRLAAGIEAVLRIADTLTKNGLLSLNFPISGPARLVCKRDQPARQRPPRENRSLPDTLFDRLASAPAAPMHLPMPASATDVQHLARLAAAADGLADPG